MARGLRQMKENVSGPLVAECAQKESDMMKVERIEQSAGNYSRTEALSHGQAVTLRLGVFTFDLHTDGSE
jgi:hypothetical protein